MEENTARGSRPTSPQLRWIIASAKKNDFAWWKDAWDKKMLEEYGADWGRVFAEWVQKVLLDFENGVGNAFSLFVHGETRRCFHDLEALQVP